MKRFRIILVAVLVWASVSVGPPLIAHGLRDHAGPGCASDGVPLEGAPRVRIADADGTARTFCSIGCAVRWLRVCGRPATSVEVTDEVSGALVDAATAFFVRSPVIAQPATGDRMHAFRNEADARRHIEAHGGRLLTGKGRPFPAPAEGGRP
jgi:hypothetical protein